MQQPIKIAMPDTQFTQDQHLEARDFFESVLSMDIDAVLFGDDTLLSELAFSGDFPEVTAKTQSINKNSDMGALYQAWDDAVLARLETVYGLQLSHTRIALPALFELIRQAKTTPCLH